MISDGKVFPARNLGVGEQWGREVESRVHSITREQAQLAQRLRNQERAAASSATSLADLQAQATRATEQIRQTADGNSLMGGQLASLEASIDRLAQSTPEVVSASASGEGFAVPAGESSRAGVAIKFPPGRGNVAVSVSLVARYVITSSARVLPSVLINGEPVLGGGQELFGLGTREGFVFAATNINSGGEDWVQVRAGSRATDAISVNPGNYFHMAVQAIFYG